MTDIFEKNTAVWFEIPSTDFNRAVAFYEQVMNNPAASYGVSKTAQVDDRSGACDIHCLDS